VNDQTDTRCINSDTGNNVHRGFGKKAGEPETVRILKGRRRWLGRDKKVQRFLFSCIHLFHKIFS